MNKRCKGASAVLHVVFAAALGLLAGAASAQTRAPQGATATNAVPPQFAEDFGDLLRIISGDADDLLDQAQLFRLIPSVLARGAAGVPYMKQRFGAARSMDEAFLAGAYVVIHGEQREWRVLREVLEQDKQKRAWLREYLGSQEAIDQHMAEGETWRPALALIPADRVRNFSIICAASEDPLVRRLGLYCGYWYADEHYWSAVKRVAGGDKDPITQRFAASLLGRRARDTNP